MAYIRSKLPAVPFGERAEQCVEEPEWGRIGCRCCPCPGSDNMDIPPFFLRVTPARPELTRAIRTRATIAPILWVGWVPACYPPALPPLTRHRSFDFGLHRDAVFAGLAHICCRRFFHMAGPHGNPHGQAAQYVADRNGQKIAHQEITPV